MPNLLRLEMAIAPKASIDVETARSQVFAIGQEQPPALAEPPARK
jgi:hypothetical protein